MSFIDELRNNAKTKKDIYDDIDNRAQKCYEKEVKSLYESIKRDIFAKAGSGQQMDSRGKKRIEGWYCMHDYWPPCEELNYIRNNKSFKLPYTTGVHGIVLDYYYEDGIVFKFKYMKTIELRRVVSWGLFHAVGEVKLINKFLINPISFHIANDITTLAKREFGERVKFEVTPALRLTKGKKSRYVRNGYIVNSWGNEDAQLGFKYFIMF